MAKLFLISFFFCCYTAGAQDPYDVVWTTPGRNASSSMPCGGGDIGMNVWVEDGDLLIYVARSGNFDEHNALLKSGRLRIRLSPNLLSGPVFRQQLHLKKGYVTLHGVLDGASVDIRIWADVHSPMAHVEIHSNRKIRVEATYESWRYQDRIVKQRENSGNSWKWAAPKNNIYRKDDVRFLDGEVLFFHHNPAKTIFDTIVSQQGMDTVKHLLYDPLKYLAFGGVFSGKGMIASGTSDGIHAGTDFRGWMLKSKAPARFHQLTLTLHNSQTKDIAQWKRGLDSVRMNALPITSSFRKNLLWWEAFWSRSFIVTDPSVKDSAAWQVGRNYQLFRYMLACNARGVWPTKFNGGLLTMDPVFTNDIELTPDFRNWGGGLHTMQNQRLVYFPMIRSGDWDMMQAQFDFYFRIMRNAELRSRVYWGHEGGCFTEQMEQFGLPNFAEYGTKRPTWFDKGVEYNAWLEYQWDSVLEFCLMMLEEHSYTGRDIRNRLPFLESVLRFFDEHYQWLALRRGVKPLDGNGKLILYPGSAAETYKMAYNATSTIAGLRTIAQRLCALPGDHLTETQRLHWSGFLKRLPDLSYRNMDGHVTIAPAQSWERINNTESPQLYPVFPWGIFGIGKPGLDTALNTWHLDTSVLKFRSHVGWKQDNIWAARLGLRDEAWRLTSLKLQNGSRRFPAFWGPGFDWVPDHNWGGSGMIGLQEMLLQTDDKKIFLFPAWPTDIDVHFKLHAPYNTTVEASLENGKIIFLKVLPDHRKKDLQLMIGE
jgi:hypothetical protein